ncbi:cystatin-B-like [Carassius auratus]|uniref:Cystatin-B-like n=1 Tax=Carassius auratus TaxID=7957 RepID=A0A6P6MIY3_CARAU|nr:cystatin-B-like [Carassius auratus]
MSMCGAWSPVKPVTLEVIKICLEMRKSIEDRAVNGNDSKVYIPSVYSSQIVNGTNYVVKVFLGGRDDGVCVHAKIHQALPCNDGKLTLSGFKFPKTFDEPLEPF